MAYGATTVSFASGSSSRSDVGAARFSVLVLVAIILSQLLIGGIATAQTPELLREQGEYTAAYDKASPVMSAGMQLTAAMAAVDQVAYGLSPDAPLADQLTWLRRGVTAAENAVKLDPNSSKALVQLARARGEIARRSGILQNLNVAGDLKKLFDQALALNPNDPDALVGLAIWNLELVQAGVGWLYGGNLNEVLPLLERGIAAAPKQINLRVEYGKALLAMDNEPEAAKQLGVALQLPAKSASDKVEQERAAALLAH